MAKTSISLDENPFLDGKFWIGDPCYVFPNNDFNPETEDEWGDFVEIMYEDGERAHVGWYEYDGIRFFMANTKWGDGGYDVTDKFGNRLGEVGVDAGLIAYIPIELVDRWNPSVSSRNLGIIVDIKSNISYSEGNFFTEQAVVITGDIEDEDEDFYDEDELEEEEEEGYESDADDIESDNPNDFG